MSAHLASSSLYIRVRQAVDRSLYLRLLRLVLNELVELLLVFCAHILERRSGLRADACLVHCGECVVIGIEA